MPDIEKIIETFSEKGACPKHKNFEGPITCDVCLIGQLALSFIRLAYKSGEEKETASCQEALSQMNQAYNETREFDKQEARQSLRLEIVESLEKAKKPSLYLVTKKISDDSELNTAMREERVIGFNAGINRAIEITKGKE